MASLTSIGSVVGIGTRRFVVVGHRMTRDGGNAGWGYLVVPYPLGFVDEGSLTLVPASAIGEVVSEGYASEAGSAHLAQLDELAQASADIPYEAYEYNVALLQGLAQELQHATAEEGGADA